MTTISECKRTAVYGLQYIPTPTQSPHTVNIYLGTEGGVLNHAENAEIILEFF
jgi:hypothetical protein